MHIGPDDAFPAGGRSPSWPWVLLGGVIVTIVLAIALFPGWWPGLG